MNILEEIKDQLIHREGLRLKPYRCTAGKLSIGVGRNLDSKGISEEEAMSMLHTDIMECSRDLNSIFPDFCMFPKRKRLALLDLRFNIGGYGFRTFQKMIKAILKKDWSTAAMELIDSKWYSQVGDRAKNVVSLMAENG